MVEDYLINSARIILWCLKVLSTSNKYFCPHIFRNGFTPPFPTGNLPGILQLMRSLKFLTNKIFLKLQCKYRKYCYSYAKSPPPQATLLRGRSPFQAIQEVCRHENNIINFYMQSCQMFKLDQHMQRLDRFLLLADFWSYQGPI